MNALRSFSRVWAVDFEFTAPPGCRPLPLCVVARELRTGQTRRRWLADDAAELPPYGTTADDLVISYYASAELGCHLALGWPLPSRIVDLYVEFRRLLAGRPPACGHGLLGAMSYFGLDALSVVEKADMRALAQRGGPFTAAERASLLAYCEDDVDALGRLAEIMLPAVDLPRALLRGRYMAAVARMEWVGVPLDVQTLDRLLGHWHAIKGRLIADIDRQYRVFSPVGRRVVDPSSRLGSEILAHARHWGLDADDLADAVDAVWHEEREASRDVLDARRSARRDTGLTPYRIQKLENNGFDHSAVPGLDALGRELARELPALGIGAGYDLDGSEEDEYGGKLWDVLRAPDPLTLPKHHPAILRRACEWLASRPHEEERRYSFPLTFSSARWANWLTTHGIAWPRLPSGALALDDETFKEMARKHPAEIGPVREALRLQRGGMKRIELAVGPDGRNRVLLSPFASKTGRNQPSNSKFIFGPSVWLRSLIQPWPGRAVAYVDWSAQELAIAAALSGDKVMQDAYTSGDPYIYLAIRAGAVPLDATKKTHPSQREAFKVVSLGVLYGLSADGLSRRLDIGPAEGRELLQMHQRTFRRFWEWSDAVEARVMLGGSLKTVFGWELASGADPNPRSARNWPMQAHGAEMMRLACCLATEEGIAVCAPIHDALLVEGPAEDIESVSARTAGIMRQAGEVVLNGFTVRTDIKILRHPDRFADDRGKATWETVVTLLEEIEREEHPPHGYAGTPRTDAPPVYSSFFPSMETEGWPWAGMI